MRRITRQLSTYLLMLLMAAFVVVPVADALACSVEPHTSTLHVETTADAADTDADGDTDSGKHASGGACSHNHCHHSTLSLPAQHFAAFAAPLMARWMPVGDAVTYAVTLDELTRPPRA